MDLALSLYISLQQCVTLLYACISFLLPKTSTGRTQEAATTRDSLMQSRQTRVPKPEKKKKKSCTSISLYIYRTQPPSCCWSIRPEETASELFTSPSACDMITIELSCNATTSQQFLTFLFALRGNVFSSRIHNKKRNFFSFLKKGNIGYIF